VYTVDRAAPVAGSLLGLVGQTNITFDFSEPITEGGGDASQIVITASPPATATAFDLDGLTATITLSRAVILSDFGTLTLAANPGSPPEDAAGNPVDSTISSLLESADSAPPQAVSALTQDRDSNGRLDAVEVTFNEAIEATSLNIVNWEVENHTISAVTIGSSSDKVLLFVDEVGPVNSGILVIVRYTGSAVTTDANGNNLAPFSLADPDVVDGIPPIVLAGGVTAALNGVELTIEFSEPVADIDPTVAGSDIRNVLRIRFDNDTNVGGASDLVVVLDGDGRDDTLVFAANAKFVANDFLTDAIILEAGAIEDRVGNPIALTRVNITQDGEIIDLLGNGLDPQTQQILGLSIGGFILLLVVIIIILAIRRRRSSTPPEHLDADNIMMEFDTNKDGVLDATELAAFVLAQERKNMEHAKSHGEIASPKSGKKVNPAENLDIEL
jgi:hypothetical protein